MKLFAELKAMWDELPNKSCRKLHAAMIEAGYDVSLPTCQRAIKRFKDVNPAVTTAEDMLGTELRADEIGQLDKDMRELKKKTLAQLHELQERERLVTNIMLMRFTQRKADKLALAPKEMAAFISAMSEAHAPVMEAPIAPPAHANGHANGHDKLIDVTPASNEVAGAIDRFLRAEGAAA